ncbi:putative pentatricopeptide repeat-containing protein [Spatholobus suberectus]|nr:putative pentatricopeptide repeat-containing protein [Spatholobus suberectus]
MVMVGGLKLQSVTPYKTFIDNHLPLPSVAPPTTVVHAQERKEGGNEEEDEEEERRERCGEWGDMFSMLCLATRLSFSLATFTLSLSWFPKRMISNAPAATVKCSSQCFGESPISLLERCKSMYQLKQIHSHTIKMGLSSDPLFRNRVIAFCCAHESGNMDYARQMFDTIPHPSLFIWNTMIKGYSRINLPENGVSMYLLMLANNIKPDRFTFPFLLKGFTRDMALQHGKVLLNHAVKHGFDSNLFVQKAYIHMFSLCGLVNLAHKVFDMGDAWEVVTWNIMLSGYNRVKQFKRSKKLFIEMEKRGVSPNSVTLVLMLSACSKLKDLDGGKHIYKYIKEGIVEPNLILENALIDMFAACEEMDEAQEPGHYYSSYGGIMS